MRRGSSAKLCLEGEATKFNKRACFTYRLIQRATELATRRNTPAEILALLPACLYSVIFLLRMLLDNIPEGGSFPVSDDLKYSD